MKEDIQDLARRLGERLDEALETNDKLKRERNQLVDRAREAERRTKQVQARVREIEEKLGILEQLREESYQQVVAELFRVPSKRAARQTAVVATISITVTVVVALWSTSHSIESSKDQREQTTQAIMERLEALQKQEDVKRVAVFFEKYEYSSIDMIAIMFKTKFLKHYPEMSNDVFIEALQRIGAEKGLILEARSRIESWTVDSVHIYQRWARDLLRAIEAKQDLGDEQTYYRTYMRQPEDTTKYGDLQYLPNMEADAIVKNQFLRSVSMMLRRSKLHLEVQEQESVKTK